MPIYDYTAIDDYGKKVYGQMEANNERDLADKLGSSGYYLLEAKKVELIIAKPGKREKAKDTSKESSYTTREPKGYWETEDSGRETHYHQHIHIGPPGGGYSTPVPHRSPGLLQRWRESDFWIVFWILLFWPFALYLIWSSKRTFKDKIVCTIAVPLTLLIAASIWKVWKVMTI